MTLSSPGSFVATFRRVSPVSAAVVIALGGLALLGWLLHSNVLKSVLPGHVAMNPMTAMSFILAGIALLILHTNRGGRRVSLVGNLCSAAVLLIGSMKLMEYFAGWDSGIDRILFAQSLDTQGGPVPNRMAPNTALTFVLVGLGLGSMGIGAAFRRSLYKHLALPPLTISMLAVTGYAYGMRPFYGVASHIPMALNTSIAFLALSVGILFSYPERGLTAVFARNDLGGAMARRLFPLTVGTLLALGWLRTHMGKMGLYDAEVGVQVSVFVSSVVVGIVIWITAHSLSRADTERQRAAEFLKVAHDDLERRVEERTVELTQANRALEHEMADRLRTEEALRKSEGQLRQAQKMEAIGRLAGGVAHDFNNMLTAILGHCQLMRLRFSEEDPVLKDAEEIEKAGQRAAALTRQLLAFSRQQVLQPKVLNLNDLVNEMDRMLRRLIGADIDLLTVPDMSIGTIQADPGQIEQVLMNLVVNSRDAMPDGGKITIETSEADLDEIYARSRPGLRPGRYVLLAVSDTGCGMDAETRAQVFEPFFTTKEAGKGTGLGLSTVYGIVKQSDGYVDVYSEPGHGASFKIYFPRANAAAEKVRAGWPVEKAPRGTETILLVEDEDLVRAVVRKSLELYGYCVVTAQDGREALKTLEADVQAFDLIITDIMLPHMRGPELAERASRMSPNSKILFISGYTDKTIIHRGILTAGNAYLQKPFTPETLARKVREVLDGGRSRAA